LREICIREKGKRQKNHDVFLLVGSKILLKHTRRRPRGYKRNNRDGCQIHTPWDRSSLVSVNRPETSSGNESFPYLTGDGQVGRVFSLAGTRMCGIERKEHGQSN